MDLIQALWLAMLQGFTEFLPISSSGHLVLLPRLMEWVDQGLAFDVAVHLGTLLAVVTFFRDELMAMARAWLHSLLGRGRSHEADLAWYVIVATLPAVLAGALFSSQIESLLRSPLVVAAATGLFGALLWYADATGERRRGEAEIGWRDAVIVGMAQALALVPGTSRSGITMTAGLLLGLTREASARFSFLLSVPVIAAATAWELLKLTGTPEPVDWPALVLGASVAAIVAYGTIRLFLALLGRIGMAPFAIYRLLLAAWLFWLYA